MEHVTHWVTLLLLTDRMTHGTCHTLSHSSTTDWQDDIWNMSHTESLFYYWLAGWHLEHVTHWVTLLLLTDRMTHGTCHTLSNSSTTDWQDDTWNMSHTESLFHYWLAGWHLEHITLSHSSTTEWQDDIWNMSHTESLFYYWLAGWHLEHVTHWVTLLLLTDKMTHGTCHTLSNSSTTDWQDDTWNMSHTESLFHYWLAGWHLEHITLSHSSTTEWQDDIWNISHTESLFYYWLAGWHLEHVTHWVTLLLLTDRMTPGTCHTLSNSSTTDWQDDTWNMSHTESLFYYWLTGWHLEHVTLSNSSTTEWQDDIWNMSHWVTLLLLTGRTTSDTGESTTGFFLH